VCVRIRYAPSTMRAVRWRSLDAVETRHAAALPPVGPSASRTGPWNAPSKSVGGMHGGSESMDVLNRGVRLALPPGLRFASGIANSRREPRR
jgi:hypothetical protein